MDHELRGPAQIAFSVDSSPFRSFRRTAFRLSWMAKFQAAAGPAWTDSDPYWQGRPTSAFFYRRGGLAVGARGAVVRVITRDPCLFLFSGSGLTRSSFAAGLKAGSARPPRAVRFNRDGSTTWSSSPADGATISSPPASSFSFYLSVSFAMKRAFCRFVWVWFFEI